MCVAGPKVVDGLRCIVRRQDDFAARVARAASASARALTFGATGAPRSCRRAIQPVRLVCARLGVPQTCCSEPTQHCCVAQKSTTTRREISCGTSHAIPITATIGVQSLLSRRVEWCAAHPAHLSTSCSCLSASASSGVIDEFSQRGSVLCRARIIGRVTGIGAQP